MHTHQLLTDDSGTETIEPEETIISDEKPHEIAEKTFADFNVRADIVESLADAGSVMAWIGKGWVMPASARDSTISARTL